MTTVYLPANVSAGKVLLAISAERQIFGDHGYWKIAQALAGCYASNGGIVCKESAKAIVEKAIRAVAE